ncbi:MAG: histidinol-phosphate transaminase [Dehalococcoidia bacterium]
MTAAHHEDDLLRYVRPDLLRMAGYEPIEPVEVLAERLGVPPERIVKLDGNENLYGPSPKALAVLHGAIDYNIYPDPDQRPVRAALATYTGVAAEHIVAGSGSDELIDLVGRALLTPGDRVIDLVPTFGMYAFTTDVCGGVYTPVRRAPDFSVDLAAVEAAVDDRTKLIFVASPNNPSGNLLPREDLARLLALGPPVVVDEAYVEFSGGSVVGLVPERANLIVLRTFSKWAGLAGLRAGYGVLPRPLADLLMVIKQPYSLNVAAEAAVLASLEDRDVLFRRVDAIVGERERMAARLSAIPFLRPWPSSANFVLCDVTRGDARLLRDGLRRRGIFTRYFGREGLSDKIRISVGLPQHTDILVAALEEMGDEPRD